MVARLLDDTVALDCTETRYLSVPVSPSPWYHSLFLLPLFPSLSLSGDGGGAVRHKRRRPPNDTERRKTE